MSMTRNKIEAAAAEARRFIQAAEAAMGRLDKEVRHRDEANAWRAERGYDGPQPSPGPSEYDYSYGSAETGALRRASLELTRNLAELRK